MEHQIEGLGLSSTEGHLLSYVERYGPCRVKELVRVFGLKPSTVTSMVDRLEGRDLLLREVNPEDRRSFLISTTSAAREVVVAAGAYLEAFEKAVARRVTPQDRASFHKVLATIDDLTRVDVRPASSGPRGSGDKPE